MKKPLFILCLLFVFVGRPVAAQIPENFRDCISVPDTLDGMEVQITAEKLPEFEGGMPAFYKMISKNMKVSEESRKFTLACAKFYLTFVVDTLGNVREYCLKPKYCELKLEPFRFSPWVPAENGGRKVPFRFFMPMYVHLE